MSLSVPAFIGVMDRVRVLLKRIRELVLRMEMESIVFQVGYLFSWHAVEVFVVLSE